MKFTFLISCLLLNTVVLATNFDSLRQSLSTQVGRQRVPTLLRLCNTDYRGIIPNEESRAYGQELFRLASSLKDTAAQVEACLCIANSQDRSSPQSDAAAWFAKSEKLARQKPELLAKTLFWKIRYFYELGKIDSALWLFKQGDALTKRFTLFSARVRLLGNAGKMYSNAGQFKMADSLAKEAFRFCKNRRDSAVAHTFWGNVKEDQGQLDDAFRAFLMAYRLEKKGGDPILATYNLQQCAGILRDQGRLEQAAAYLEEAVRLAQKTGNIAGLAGAYHTLGGVCKELKVYTKALKYYQLSLALKKDVGRPQKVLNTIESMSDLYYQVGKYDSCLALCQQFLPLSQQIAYIKAEAPLALRAALTAGKMNQPTQARHYLAIGEQVLSKVKPSEELPGLYRLAADAAAVAQDFPKAYRYQTLFQRIQDSIYNTEKSQIIAELESRFESEKQKQQIEDLEEKNELQAIRIAKERSQRFALLGGAILLAILAVVLWRNVKSRKQHNATLEKINQNLNLKNKEVQTLLREVHHRVKNNLQIISSLLRLQARGVEQDDAAEALRISQSRVQSIALLHQRLYQDNGLNQVPIRTYFHDLAQSLQDTYRLDENQIQLQVNVDDFELDVDLAIPIGLITNELIINAIKHAFPLHRAGLIELLVKKTGAQIAIFVKDNGIGLKLSEGKPLIKKSAFGLELVESLAEKIQGHLSFRNGQGTQVELLIPIALHPQPVAHD